MLEGRLRPESEDSPLWTGRRLERRRVDDGGGTEPSSTRWSGRKWPVRSGGGLMTDGAEGAENTEYFDKFGNQRTMGVAKMH